MVWGGVSNLGRPIWGFTGTAAVEDRAFGLLPRVCALLFEVPYTGKVPLVSATQFGFFLLEAFYPSNWIVENLDSMHPVEPGEISHDLPLVRMAYLHDFFNVLHSPFGRIANDLAMIRSTTAPGHIADLMA